MSLRVKDLSFSYGKECILKGISFTAEKGEIVSIAGPNGSGKSTLLKCMNMILRSRGTIFFDSIDLRKMKSRQRAQIIAYVPQNISGSFPIMVFDSVLLGRRPYIGWRAGTRDLEIVSKIISSMRLSHLMLKSYNQLSGGERQKVLIARALAQEPKLFLLDEPTSNLDLKHQLEVFACLKEISKRDGISVIITIHDLNLASQFSDTVIFLKDGYIHDSGKPERVMTRENIKTVYGVDAIIHRESEKPYVIPYKNG
ncbi:MAG: ABC transporter ATP-binding protein [bacterium]